jgi:hypothetical protein
MPAGPVGCGGGCLVIAIVFVLLTASAAVIWWSFRDLAGVSALQDIDRRIAA